MDINFIKSSVLFKNLNAEETGKALEILEAEIKKYKKNDCIHSQYTEMKKFGFVLSGAVQVCVDDVDGNKMIMAQVVPGQTFGESLCFLKIKNSPVYIYASEDSEILFLSVKTLFSGESNEIYNELEKRFTEMLSKRTLSMNDRIQVLSKIKLRDKLMTYFSQISQKSGSLTFNLPGNREDLASYMGTDRSALCRELSAMKKEGIIDYHKNTVKIIR